MRNVRRKVKLLLAGILFMLCFGAVSVSAEETNPIQIEGTYRMEEAPEFGYQTEGYETDVPKDDGLYYKFKTLQNEGCYNLNFIADWYEGYGCKVQLTVYDNYKNVVCSSGRFEADEYRLRYNDYDYKGYDGGICIDNLSPDTYYYVYVESTSGLKDYGSLYFKMNLYYVPFAAPQNVKLTYNKEGLPVIHWSNTNSYNTYSTLTSYDYFRVEASSSSDFENCTSYYVGGPVETSYVVGYPTSSKMYYRVVGYQYFYDPNDGSESNIMSKKSAIVSTEEIVNGATYVVDFMKYKVTDNQVNGFGTVTLIGTTKKKNDKNFTSLKVGKKVRIYGRMFNITEIENRAFKGYKKLKKITIGDNVKVIGKDCFSGCYGVKSVSLGTAVTAISDRAFYNCKKLSNIKIKTQSLNSIGQKAFRGIYKKAVFKVPASKSYYYRGILGTRAGYRNTMKIKA